MGNENSSQFLPSSKGLDSSKHVVLGKDTLQSLLKESNCTSKPRQHFTQPKPCSELQLGMVFENFRRCRGDVLLNGELFQIHHTESCEAQIEENRKERIVYRDPSKFDIIYSMSRVTARQRLTQSTQGSTSNTPSTVLIIKPTCRKQWPGKIETAHSATHQFKINSSKSTIDTSLWFVPSYFSLPQCGDGGSSYRTRDLLHFVKHTCGNKTTSFQTGDKVKHKTISNDLPLKPTSPISRSTYATRSLSNTYGKKTLTSIVHTTKYERICTRPGDSVIPVPRSQPKCDLSIAETTSPEVNMEADVWVASDSNDDCSFENKHQRDLLADGPAKTYCSYSRRKKAGSATLPKRYRTKRRSNNDREPSTLPVPIRTSCTVSHSEKEYSITKLLMDNDTWARISTYARGNMTELPAAVGLEADANSYNASYNDDAPHTKKRHI